MDIESTPATTTTTATIAPRKLWFGFATSAGAFTLLGFLDVLVVWRTCTSFGHGTGVTGHEDARVLSFCISLALFLLTSTAGLVSYRNWRSLSRSNRLMEAEATDRREFMALLGVFISFTMAMGIFWLSLGPLFIVFCQRAK